MPRDVVVVEGPAGSGKTALMLSLAGRMRIRGGKVKVAGLVLLEQAAPYGGEPAIWTAAARRMSGATWRRS